MREVRYGIRIEERRRGNIDCMWHLSNRCDHRCIWYDWIILVWTDSGYLAWHCRKLQNSKENVFSCPRSLPRLHLRFSPKPQEISNMYMLTTACQHLLFPSLLSWHLPKSESELESGGWQTKCLAVVDNVPIGNHPSEILPKVSVGLNRQLSGTLHLMVTMSSFFYICRISVSFPRA